MSSTTAKSTSIPATSLGTGTFSQPAFPGGPAFAMSSTQWLSLQTFFNNVAQLPSTLTALATTMGTGAPTDMSDFQQLINLYVSMQTQGTTFTGTLFPSIVNLAGDIANYGNSIGTYYQGLQTEIAALQAATTPAQQKQCQQNIIAIVNQLSQTAQGFSTNASTASTNLGTMASGLTIDLNTLTGTNGLFSYYNNKYGVESTTVKNLISKLSGDNAKLSKAQERYHHDVVVAATTPTYCWVMWPVGMIASAIVAGVYGSKATAALNDIHSLESTIATLTAEEQADTNLMNALQSTTTQAQTLSGKVSDALNIIQGMEGNWSTICSDLTNITSVLNNDFNTGLAFLENLNYAALTNDWQTLAQLATTYQTNAFVTVQ
ncbi:MAG: alpha-xenorhabdolysin family binary toxin subunit A [Bacteroidota bacterium]|nr:alpha-xenorhabdolysin family binary toxin subunit A [Bacteroidota bacterium]